MKGKICFIIQQYDNGGGTERVLSQISSGLSKTGYDVSIISIGKGLTPVFETDPSVELYQLNRQSKGDNIKIPRRVYQFFEIISTRAELYRLAIKLKPSVIIAVDVVLYHYARYLGRKMNVKTVGWEHYCLDSRKGPLIDYSRRLAIAHASRMIVISKGDQRSYKERFKNAKNIRLIYNPVHADELFLADMGNKAVIAAGRLTYQKGFDLLLSAWVAVSKEAPEWQLLIYGDGEDREKLMNTVKEYGLKNVSFMGYAADLSSSMRNASIFVLSSRYEGFGLVLAEAQSNGLPCVSFDCREGPREIIDDGINGFLVEEGNTDMLGERLLRLIKSRDLRKSFSRSAHKDLYRFCPDRIIKEWDRTLTEIMRE